MIGVEEEESHEKTCWPKRAKPSVPPKTPPPSELLKTTVSVIHSPQSLTGKGQNKALTRIGALCLRGMLRQGETCSKGPIEDRPADLVFQYRISECR
jgi:hypothetical protein